MRTSLSVLGMWIRGKRNRTAFLPGVLLLFAVIVFSDSFSEGIKGTGDFEFYLDKAAFKASGGKTLLEVYIHIPNSELRFKKTKGRWGAEAALVIRIRDQAGEDVVRERKEMEFFTDTEDNANTPLNFQSVVMRYVMEPGRYQLSCEIEDMNSPKLTLIGMIEKKHAFSAVQNVPVYVPPYKQSELNLSDPKFVWKVEKSGGTTFFRPNAARLYGLYNDTLKVYYELYLPGAAAAVDVKSTIVNADGEITSESNYGFSTKEQAPSSIIDQVRVYTLLLSEDLTTFPAGAYTLYCEVSTDGSPAVRFRGGSFDIAWEMRTWESSRRDLLAEARFLLDDEDYKAFKRLGKAEQENMLTGAWKRIDPNPKTGVNEAYEEFKKRLDYVNEHYSDYQLGVHTDRGLIYLRYGKPDEVIMDVIPMNRETTADALEKVKDRFYSVIFSTHGGRPVSRNPGQAVVMDRRRVGKVGEGGNVAFPFELWVYNGRGNPILNKDSSLPPDVGLRFIFIDRDGFGRYKLEMSSSLLDER